MHTLLLAVQLEIVKVGVDPVWFRLGKFAVHWYGVLYAIAFLTAFRYGVVPHLTRYGMDRELIRWGVRISAP